MATKKDKQPANHPPEGAWPGDPDYQRPAAPTRQDLEVLDKGLKVMDATAISLCMDNRLPIVVFNLRTPGNIKRAITGEPVGSLVTA